MPTSVQRVKPVIEMFKKKGFIGRQFDVFDCTPSGRILACVTNDGDGDRVELHTLLGSEKLRTCRFFSQDATEIRQLDFLGEDLLVGLTADSAGAGRLLFWRIESTPSRLAQVRMGSSVLFGLPVNEQGMFYSPKGDYCGFIVDDSPSVVLCRIQWVNGIPKLKKHKLFKLDWWYGSAVCNFSEDGTYFLLVEELLAPKDHVRFRLYNLQDSSLRRKGIRASKHQSGSRLVSGSSCVAAWNGKSKIEIWDLVQNNRKATLSSQSQQDSGDIDFMMSPDGRTLVMVEWREHSSCSVWDLSTQQRLCKKRIYIDSERFRSCQKGRYLVYASRDGHNHNCFALLDFGRPNFGRGRDWNESYL